MDTKRLYVDFHVLQTVPPSCVNRDDTGSPKTAVYGGATRARVLSGVEARDPQNVCRRNGRHGRDRKTYPESN